MKRIQTLFVILLTCIFSYAQERVNERVYVHLDKDNYIAGEDILMKFYLVDREFSPSLLSKVGYIEISDTERPQMQTMLALKDGYGAGKIKIPMHIPTGTYQLMGYTRYMRNEGEDAFFKRTISIVNVTYPTDKDRLTLLDEGEPIKESSKESSNIQVTTDKKSYLNRSAVQLSLGQLPNNVSDLIISVSRNDSVMKMPVVNKDLWKQQVGSTTPVFSKKEWSPEYEGHIITGQTILTSEEAQLFDYTQMAADIGFVSKDIRYIRGQMKTDDGKALFYTKDIFGSQEVVITALSSDESRTVRMDIQTPYCEFLPDYLPDLEITPEKKSLMERNIGAQLHLIMGLDSLGQKIELESYYNLRNHLSYNLDEYTRFSTMRETFIEFVRRIHISRIDGKQKIKVLLDEEKRFNAGNTLVLLDGVPIHDHEDIINYNPRMIKSIDIYSGRYIFGGDVFECMVAFNSLRGEFSGIQLSDQSQLVEYECPQLYTPFAFPVYQTETELKSRKPDFRHTLFWEPFAEKRQDLQSGVVFYTSDLCGEFQVVVEGITADGEFVYGETSFIVNNQR